jgi:hypothetical protein
MVKQWMMHLKIGNDLQRRVTSYYDLLWMKLRGHDDSEIMKDLPETLRTDISKQLFNALKQSEIFPKDDNGAALMIVRNCKMLMT